MDGRRLLSLAVTITCIVWAPASANAYPIFARKNKMSCTTCHERAFPKLNVFGVHYKENGYQLMAGAETSALDDSAFAPGTIGDPLTLAKAVPLAVRLGTSIELIANPDAAGRGPVELGAPMNLTLLGGGALFKNVSAAIAYQVAPSQFLTYAYVGVHNIGAGGLLNVRVGRFLLLDFVRSGHRRLTVLGNATMTRHVGLNPFRFDDHVLGIDAWGRPARGPFFWELAVVNGAGDITSPDDLDEFKDVFVNLRYTLMERYTLGAFGYFGSARLGDDSQGIEREWGDRFWRAGAVLELELGRALGYAHVVYARNRNPEGLDPAVPGWFIGLRAQVDLTITRRLFGILRWDWLDANDDAHDLHLVSAHIAYMLATNVRLAFELQQDVNAYRDGAGDGLGASRFFLLADLAF